MRAFRLLSPALLVAALFVSTSLGGTAMAEEGPNWRTNLDEAEKLALQTNRLVLIHFWATWCGPCRALEGNVFSQPGVGQTMESRFVPVKVNIEDFPATARLYDIRFYPTDVIVTPSGRVIAKLKCPQDPRQYLAQLMQYGGTVPPTAIAAGGPLANAVAQAPTVPATPPAGYQPQPQPQPSAPRTGATGLSMYTNNNPPANPNRGDTLPGPAEMAPPQYSPAPTAVAAVPPNPAPIAQATAQQPITPQPSQVVPAVAASAQPPVGLDGYCPVTLIERHHETPADPRCWAQGNPRWGVVHRGTVYLFVGPEQQQRFLADPDRYSPALSGNDPVLAFDRGQLQQGTRQFGTFFSDRIFLFTSAENLRKFTQSVDIARHYADEVRQAESNSHVAMH